MSVNPRVSLFTKTVTDKNNTNYTYDNIGRLTQAGSDSFSYDKVGNNLNDNAVYNILNNRLSASDIYTVTYDSMGNIKTKYNKLTKTTSNYTFNSRNQLINYTQTDENNQTTKTLTYTYDAFNRRVSKTEDGVEQKYHYDGDDIVAILDSNNAVIATITHDESIDTPLSITNANGTFYYHRDEKRKANNNCLLFAASEPKRSERSVAVEEGSIIALTDSSGQVVESFTYDNHYGTIVNHTVTTETNNPYAYTGRELDTSELYYYRARYYDPSLQRFLSEDPIGFSSGDFNFYRYVLGDTVNLVDPYGLFTNHSKVPVEIRPESAPHRTIAPGETYSGPIDGFRVPAWDYDWIKIPDPANNECNLNEDGTPDVPWYVPEYYIPIHRAPGRKPIDYNWDRGGFF